MSVFNEKFFEVLNHEGVVSIVSWGNGEANVTNTWNSYLVIKDDRILLPAAGMNSTEADVKVNNKVKLNLGSKEVEGFNNYQKKFSNKPFNELIEKIKNLNEAITQDQSLGKGFCIGHSYFCNAEECTLEWMKDIVEFDIFPMLSEYWFDDESKLNEWKDILYGVFK